MVDDTTCIFCKIAAHELGATIVYEDDLVMAFEDVHPAAPAHVLIIPKKHHATMLDNVSGELYAAMINAAGEVARIKGIDKRGFRTLINTGSDAGQTVHHLHMHVIGGVTLGEKLIP